MELDASTKYHLVIRHLGATSSNTVDIEEDSTPSQYSGGAVNFGTNGTGWTGDDSADLNFRIYSGAAAITAIGDYRHSDATTARHLVFAGGELYKNVSGTLTSLTNREAAAMTASSTVFPSWTVGGDAFFLTNNTEISKKFYVLSSTEYWENEGLAKPTTDITIGVDSGTPLPNDTYHIDWYWWNNDTKVRSVPRYDGIADGDNDVVTSTQHISLSGFPAAPERLGDRATHIRIEIKNPSSSVFRQVAEISVGTTVATITSPDVSDPITTLQGEYNHDVPGLHVCKKVAENRQFILNCVDENSVRRPNRMYFSAINGRDPYYESYDTNAYRDFGGSDGDYGTALFFMPPRTLIIGFKNSIYAIDARSPGTSDVVTISKEVGIAHHNAGRVTGGKLFFFSNAAENIGHYVWQPGSKEPALIRGIDNTIKSFSTTKFKSANCATFAPGDDRYQFWCSLTTTKILVFDYVLQAWSIYTKPSGREFGVMSTVESSGIDAIYLGGVDGVEYKQDTGTDDAGTAFTGVFTTGAMDYGFPQTLKRQRWIRYLTQVNSSGSIALSTDRDYGDRGAISASLSHEPLGSARGGTTMVWGSGTWGTDIWAATTDSKRQSSHRGIGEVFEHKFSSGDPFYLKGIQFGWQPTGRE